MNNNKIHIIHPKDASTDFLEEIYSYIRENTDVEINLFRLDSRNNHFSFFDSILDIPDNELIIFLGHGTSFGLSGAMTDEFQYAEFITEKQLKVFRGKNIFLLSCRSNQYLHKHFKDCDIKSAIGFPNLITDFEEVEHHDDPERLDGINQNDIDLFKTDIVNIVKYSITDFINYKLSFSQLFNRIKLRINKRVINLYNETPNKGKLSLGKMLNDMVDGLSFHQKFY